MLKALRFLDDSGPPTRRYHQCLDQTQSDVILAQGVREAYSDLFRVNRNAQTMSQAEVKNKMKTLSEGSYTDRVLTQMAPTFTLWSSLLTFPQRRPPTSRPRRPKPRKKRRTIRPSRGLPVAAHSVRRFVYKVLIDKYQENWWEEGVSSKIRASAESRRDEEEKTKWHGTRGEGLLSYTELGHLPNITQQNWNDFEPYVRRIDWARQSSRRWSGRGT